MAGTIKEVEDAAEEQLSPEQVDEARRRVMKRVDELADALIEASHAIHGHPELGYEEHFAHDLLTKLISEAGLDVSEGAYGLDTAFEARAGTTGPVLAVLCEYDALPGIGHACGHNIIAAAGAGAGLGAAGCRRARWSGQDSGDPRRRGRRRQGPDDRGGGFQRGRRRHDGSPG